ncbi:MAG: hypothetical protein ACRBM6_34370 [Geminicoccales bacterium]
MKTFLSTSSLLLVSFMPFVGNTSEPKPVEEDGTLIIDLLPGHTVYHEREQEAGVITAISITPGVHNIADLMSLCEDLRVAAGLEHMTSDGLALEALFVVPYKGMMIEGYYFPINDNLGSGTLISGNSLATDALNGIVGQAGIPAGILDETDVEQEISCELNEPAWHVRWEDVRLVDGEKPDTVIEHAYRRFMTVYQSILDHSRVIPVSAILR